MENLKENHLAVSENEWQELAERFKVLQIPNFQGKKFDWEDPGDRILLNHMFQYDERFARLIDHQIPDLSKRFIIRTRTQEIEQFNVSSPQAGSDKYLSISGATHVNTRVSSSSTPGIAIFHSQEMGNLLKPPGVTLNYRFPDSSTSRTIFYNVTFKIWMYDGGFTGAPDLTANFLLRSSGYGYTGTTRRRTVGLTGSEHTFLSISVPASQVRGKEILFELRHEDWATSTINWWFYSATVSSVILTSFSTGNKLSNINE